uniref:Uncharacterized protein n=1 Tax=Magallana gigas TaxID=29159 RepID=K1PTF0_MAGGI
MTLCVVVNETKNCFVSTCTCPNSRTRRGVNSHLLTPNPSSGPQEATCKFEVILSENISDNCQGKMTNLRDERTENPMEYTTLKCETRKNTMKNKGKHLRNTDVYLFCSSSPEFVLLHGEERCHPVKVLKNLFFLSFGLEVYNLIIPISCISKVIFGTGDKLQAVTLTANSSFVRAAQHQVCL